MIPDLTRTAEGIEMHIGANFLGHFALTAVLLLLLAMSREGRVVSASTVAAVHVTMDFGNWLSQQRYSAGKIQSWSKLAMLLFAFELDRKARVNSWSIAAFAAHPGVPASNLQNNGPSLGRPHLTLTTRIGVTVTGSVGQSTAAGALPLLGAATDPAAAGGRLLRTRWMGRHQGHAGRRRSAERRSECRHCSAAVARKPKR
jgi:NAD(P)-dependent dehydrogenase (short-subunit alcohol dehydrogenase family)